jgi:hypothetical protein
MFENYPLSIEPSLQELKTWMNLAGEFRRSGRWIESMAVLKQVIEKQGYISLNVLYYLHKSAVGACSIDLAWYLMAQSNKLLKLKLGLGFEEIDQLWADWRNINDPNNNQAEVNSIANYSIWDQLSERTKSILGSLVPNYFELANAVYSLLEDKDAEHLERYISGHTGDVREYIKNNELALSIWSHMERSDEVCEYLMVLFGDVQGYSRELIGNPYVQSNWPFLVNPYDVIATQLSKL